MVELLVLFQAMLERMEPKATSLKKKKPPIPTMKREMPIQIDPPMKRMSRPAIVAETGPNSMNPPPSLKLRNSGSS
jgi:hypothetical protein